MDPEAAPVRAVPVPPLVNLTNNYASLADQRQMLLSVRLIDLDPHDEEGGVGLVHGQARPAVAHLLQLRVLQAGRGGPAAATERGRGP